jgi:ElaB/YqjD/DUF883 family membrane-anchored ribosome-binding protein
MEGVVDLLVNGSPMAAFAIFLIYLYTTMQKRMDTLVEKFQTQLDDIRKEYKDDTEELRGRYDSVIETYNTERTEVRSNVASKVGEAIRHLLDLQRGLSHLAVAVEVRGDELRDLSTKVDQGLAVLKQMQEDAKIKELAKQVANRRENE